MKKIPIDKVALDTLVAQLNKSNLFANLNPQELQEIVTRSTWQQYSPGEVIMQQGTPSDSFALVIDGEVIVNVRHANRNEEIEVGRIRPFDTVGELGLLLDEPRSASIIAGNDAAILLFDKQFFSTTFKTLPGFALATSRVLARRLQQASRSMPVSSATTATTKLDPEARKLLPIEFIQRHRVLPLRVENNVLYLGFVEDPTPTVITLVREALPGMDLRPVSIDAATYNAALQSSVGGSTQTAAVSGEDFIKSGVTLDHMLKRVVAERASDLHLSAGHKPRWRIDGILMEISDLPVLDESAVMTLTRPIMLERNRKQFDSENDTDFAYAIPEVARFRVNMFRDNHGVGGVFRQIPDKILSIEQLGLPPIVRQFCDYPKGLVLVTGPTGSGKSTTLAAMIDYINKTSPAHIVTMEDPVEFVHQSKKCLVNQREIGPHSNSFARALKAVLREDPNIVLVGEMRDLETIALALETANTGHLVFGTLHTNTAVSTVNRIIDMFPADQQNQIRMVMSDNLKGVVAQTLCRKIGGGRVAALEILVPDLAVAALIREGKTHQLFSTMQTGKARGNRLLNEELARLVREKIVDKDEALSKAVDKPDLAMKLGIKLDPNAM